MSLNVTFMTCVHRQLFVIWVCYGDAFMSCGYMILYGSFVCGSISDCGKCPSKCVGTTGACCGDIKDSDTAVCTSYCLQKDYKCCGCNRMNSEAFNPDVDCVSCPPGSFCTFKNSPLSQIKHYCSSNGAIPSFKGPLYFTSSLMLALIFGFAICMID